MSSLLAANRPLSFKGIQAIVGLKANVDVNLNSHALALSREAKDKLDQFRKIRCWKQRTASKPWRYSGFTGMRSAAFSAI